MHMHTYTLSYIYIYIYIYITYTYRRHAPRPGLEALKAKHVPAVPSLFHTEDLSIYYISPFANNSRFSANIYPYTQPLFHSSVQFRESGASRRIGM